MEGDKTIYSQRNHTIDIFRALIMFTMIFVNDFWKIHDVPHWLEHAAYGEDFMGLSDIVFPCFLIAVGLSIPYAIERRMAKGYSVESTLGHILLRTFSLLVMGAFIGNSEFRLSPEAPYRIGVYWFIMVASFILVWNNYPRDASAGRKRLFRLLQLIGLCGLLYLAFTFRNPKGGVFSTYSSILGAIGWTYLVCATIYLLARDRMNILVPIWAGFILVCILVTPLREAFGGHSILNFPEPNFFNGMLDTLHIGNGCLVSFTMSGMLISIIAARNANEKDGKVLTMAIAAAAVFLILGIIAHRFWIVTKIGASPVWLFYVLSIATALYVFLDLLVRHNLTGWSKAIEPAGTATLTTYMIPYVFYGFADVTGVVLPDWLTHGFMGLVNSFCFAFIVIFVTWVLGKLHIKLRI
jgi:drug/metabolite transporter (DMT)-like permease